MKRLLGQAFVVVAVGSLATLFTPACADNDQTIYVRNVQAPPSNRQNGSCIYQPDPAAAALPEGTLDVAVRPTYNAFLLVGGQALQRSDTLNARVEPNRSHLNGAVVTVTDPNGGTLGEFTALGSGFVDPGQGTSPSFGLIAVTLVDQPTSSKLGVAPGASRLVVANVKVFGKTLGGVDLETGEFQFPIRVCNGCLISFSSGDDPATQGRDCNLSLSATGGGGGTVEGPCQVGQDEGTPCQFCREFSAACRGGT